MISLNIAIIKTENVDMKIAKVPQPWASLVMTEIIEYIMPIPDIRQDEVILIYAVREGNAQYEKAMPQDKLGELEYNEELIGNIEYPLPIGCAIGWVKIANFNPRTRDRLYVTDVHKFVNPLKINIAQIDKSILSEQCKEHNFHSIRFGNLKFPNMHQKGKYFYANSIILPLGDSAWKRFIFDKRSIYLYWSEEFAALIKWLDSKFDEFGTTESDIHVVLRHEDKEIWCEMLNRDEIDRTTVYNIYTEEETGKKITDVVDVLKFSFDKDFGLEMDYIDGKQVIDEEKKRLIAKKEENQARNKWVHIIYTPMGNKR